MGVVVGRRLRATFRLPSSNDTLTLAIEHIDKGLQGKRTVQCEMFLRGVEGGRCRRGRDVQWYGYHVCQSCADALAAEGYPENLPKYTP